MIVFDTFWLFFDQTLPKLIKYQNDCLIAAIEYSKNYYEDSDLKPSENIFFSITLKPFGTTTTPSLK